MPCYPFLRYLPRLLPWAFWLLLLAAGHPLPTIAEEPSAPQPFPAYFYPDLPPQQEFDRVAEELKAGGNFNVGRASLEQLSLALQQSDLPLAQRVNLKCEQLIELLQQNEIDAAKSGTQELLAELATDPALAAQEILIRRTAMMVYLRAAELQNCVGRHCAESCIFPIRGGGVHVEKDAARNAFVQAVKLLEADITGKKTVQWVANVASMVLGEYPDGVPLAWRLPPELFASEVTSEVAVPRMVDVAPQTGLMNPGLAGGIALADFDADGRIDLLSSSAHPDLPLRLFRNRGDGQFDDLAPQAGLTPQRGGLHCELIDYDNDGDEDIFVPRGAWWHVFGKVRNSLLNNQGNGTFVDVSRAAGLANEAYPTQTAVWGDFDNDGWLDLFVGNESAHNIVALGERAALEHYPCQLFHNNRDGTFTEMGQQAGVTNDRWCKGAAAGDFDNDGDLDLYVSNWHFDGVDPSHGRNRLYRNRGDGTFDDVSDAMQVALPERSFATWFFDYDNDGWLDIFAAAYDAGPVEATMDATVDDYLKKTTTRSCCRLFRNEQGRAFRDVSLEANVLHPWLAMGAGFGDLDNDGFLDIYLGTGGPEYDTLSPNVLLRNDQGKRFQDVTTAAGVGHLQKGHGVAFADLDNDGDQDLYEDLGGFYPGDGFANALFLNPGNSHHFLKIYLRGTTSNRNAFGARVRVSLDTPDGPCEIHRAVGSLPSFGALAPWLEIGLGNATRIRELEVLWPKSGQHQVWTDLPLDTLVRITEGDPAWQPVNLPRVDLQQHLADALAGTDAPHAHAPHPEHAPDHSAPPSTPTSDHDAPTAPPSAARLPWKLVSNGGTAELQVIDAPDSGWRVHNLSSDASAAWKVQLVLAPLAIETQHPYMLRFRARANQPRPLALGVSQGQKPWNNLGLYRTVSLTTEWQPFEFPFNASGTDPRARWHFDLAAHAANIELADLQLVDTSTGQQVLPATAPINPPAPPPMPQWQLAQRAGWQAKLSQSDPQSARVDILQVGSGPNWGLQLSRPCGAAMTNQKYVLRFDARADQPRKIAVGIGQNHAPWKSLGIYRECQLREEWQEFRFEVTPQQDEPNARISFDLADAPHAVELRHVRWEPAPTAPAQPPAAGASLSDEQAVRLAVDIEEMTLSLTPKLKRLSAGLLNLQLPSPEASALFEPEIQLQDLALPPQKKVAKQFPSVQVVVEDWASAPAPHQQSLAGLELMPAAWSDVAYFDFAKFYFVHTEPNPGDDQRRTSELGFEGLARTKQSTWRWMKGTLSVDWHKTPPDITCDCPWRITAWRVMSLRSYESPERLFEEVLDAALTDDATRRRARESAQQKIILQATQDPNFKPPHPYWEWYSFDRHPSITVVDVDRDGFDDLYATDEFGRNLLLINQRDGTFVDRAAPAGLDFDGYCNAALFADFDNDGDPDLFLGRSVQPSQYLVNEAGRFVDRSASHVSVPMPQLVSSIAAADYNRDGLLDVYVSTYGGQALDHDLFAVPQVDPPLKQFLEPHEAAHLKSLMPTFDLFRRRLGPPNLLLVNRGQGHFDRAPENEQLQVWRNTYQSTWGDYDGDGDPDLYVANDFSPNNLFRNDGPQGFTDVTEQTETADIGFGMGAAWGDYDNDGRQDLYVTNMFSKAGQRITRNLGRRISGEFNQMAGGNSLFRNLGQDRPFEKVSGLDPAKLQVEKAGWAWGGQFADVDNDGYLDIFSTCGFYTAPKDVAIEVDL